VSLFALADDLTQEVVKAGMARKGLSVGGQNELLRAIKERRLRHFLNDLTKLCGWVGLDEANPDLSKRLDKANKRRNNIMHGSVRLSRQDTLESSNALLDLIDWLRTNPFGYSIPEFPLLVIAEGEFFVVPADPAKHGGKDTPESGEPPGSSSSEDRPEPSRPMQ
jgi:hypothetical protein